MTIGFRPPPPGSTEEKLPAHILAMIVPRPYISTACETGHALASAVVRWPEHEQELRSWEKRMHERCRLNNKFTDKPCSCSCGHPRDEEAEAPAAATGSGWKSLDF